MSEANKLNRPSGSVLVSHACNESRDTDKDGNERMICIKCGDRRDMKNTQTLGVYECQGCGQKWKYPE